MGIRPQVEVVTTRTGVFRVMQKLHERSKGSDKVFGLDCEWDPARSKGGVIMEVPDILQLGKSDGFCALFRLNMIEYVPSALREVLEDPNFIKTGVGVVEDCDRIWDSYKVDSRGSVDLRYMAADMNLEPLGITYLSRQVLGETRRKYQHSTHVWTKKFINGSQLQFAAKDAVSSARIFERLNHDRLRSIHGTQVRQWTASEYLRATQRLWKKYKDRLFVYSDYKSKGGGGPAGNRESTAAFANKGARAGGQLNYESEEDKLKTSWKRDPKGASMYAEKSYYDSKPKKFEGNKGVEFVWKEKMRIKKARENVKQIKKKRALRGARSKK